LHPTTAATQVTVNNSQKHTSFPRFVDTKRTWHSILPRVTVALAVLWLAIPTTAQQPAPAVVVTTTKQRTVIEEVPVSGTVTSPRVAQLSPEIAGLVQEVLVDAGDRVDADAPLVRLDAALASLELEAAQAATDQVREELADAQRRLDDANRLARSSGIAETEIRARESEVRADAAALRLRTAEQRRAEERLQRHEIRAPFAGLIARKLTEAGEWVDPGDPMLELVADSGLRIDFPVPQGYFPRVNQETPIEISLDTLPERHIAARIGSIVPVSDPSARTFLIRVYLKEKRLPLTPGMSASGTLRLRTGEQTVAVSRDALLRHPDGRVTVWVVEGTGTTSTVTERQVQIGLAFDGMVAIRSGLQAGVRVVVEGNEALRQGQPVDIREKR
jgi:membrane fusion protein (multidrug efflux system)